MTSNIILEKDQFIRSLEISRNDNFSCFLGAGASITSGIPSAMECIWDWKQKIFLSKTQRIEKNFDKNSTDVRQIIQKWLDSKEEYPSNGAPEEYSFYVEACYPIADDRRRFFQKICNGKKPSIGYKLLCLLIHAKIINSVWTTNFDDLVSHAAIGAGLLPIDITLDTVDRIFRPQNNEELPLIKLHGDYKYGALKNTSAELEKQDETFRQSLIDFLTDKHLIVAGFSGRDESVMEALTTAYKKKGGGRLYWCGYGRSIPPQVEELINIARQNGREAFYIPADGFDNLMVSLSAAITKYHKDLEEQFKSYLEHEASSSEMTRFSISEIGSDTVVKSNMFEIILPQEVFQFEIIYTEGEKPWETLRNLTDGKQIIAVPHKGMVYALGTVQSINQTFKDRMKGPITRVSLSNFNLRKDTAFYSMLLSGVTEILATNNQLSNNRRNLIWKNNATTQGRTNDVIYTCHQAIRLSLTTDGKRHFLSFMPDFHLSSERNEEIPKLLYQEEGRKYYDKMRNAEYNDYLLEWRALLLPGKEKVLELDYPLGTSTGLTFKIRKSNTFAKIYIPNSQKKQSLTPYVSSELIGFRGIQFKEPQLVFSPKLEGMSDVPRDFHPMRGILNNKPYDYRREGSIFESDKVRLGVLCPTNDNEKFVQFLRRQNSNIDSNGTNKAYLLSFPGFSEAFATSLNIPDPTTDNWLSLPEPTGKEIKETATFIRNQITQGIDRLIADGIRKVVVIYIPTRWLEFTAYEIENEQYDLHNYIKAYCAERAVATQFIQEDTLKDPLQCQINWWLSLSYYVKSLRTPWVLDTLDKSTAFAGIGYSVTKRNGITDIVVGCSHIYNAQGQGLKYRLSKVEDELFWDRQKKPHLSYNDAYKFGTSIIDMFYNTMDNFPLRVVVHKRTFFTEAEVKGLKDSLLGHGVQEVDLIEINFDDDMRFLASKFNTNSQRLEIHPYAVPRGTCILINSYEALLWTHGVVPSVENPSYHYYLGGRYIPGPLRIRKHYGNGNLELIATEILGLTKMNWNSFDMYSQLPATVNSSNEIAKIGRLLNKREGANYDYRFFI